MRALLDVNVLIALLDADHSLHQPAVRWFGEHAELGWASCPITQNGCIRIMGHSKYANPVPITLVAQRLAEATAEPVHEFWADDISILDGDVDTTKIHGARQLTDVYLLALSVKHNGRLVTFDRGLATSAVKRAKPQNLLLI